ncbi:MAG TPA: HNH endonuclease [Chromatiaceae bacterium]|jgi:5-methylcytosine-specific restriction endonuclease McrA|nr:MAG: HNH endonuclease [Thiohalocapsa sp. PB-PSB1]QQO52161.1 MAG: HNH endonuclease [Thiohalocapsa sp. PB-PSB1]HBG94363.1 HNH endonuclease [Chromatiaceae bacterium]HCS91156.1 HNH endonuclease [Chromatiaceae bacterium]
MVSLNQQVLRTDLAGMPLEWVNYKVAARLYFLGQVAYTCGSSLIRLHGGINALTRQQSVMEIHSIIATHGTHHARNKLRQDYAPPLSNRTLFQRDNHLCLYCGGHFSARNLSRDHVRPISQGGVDCWNNVVTACVRCNNYKAGRTPERAGMLLLAVPFTPTHAEYIYLMGRNVLADQMAFLSAHFPRTSPLLRRIKQG